MVLLPPFPSLGGGGKESFLYSFSFITQPESPPPLTQNLTMKGQEGGRTCQHSFGEMGEGVGVWGTDCPSSANLVVLVTTKVSHLTSEKPQNAHYLAHFYCYEGDTGVVLITLHTHRTFACV